LTNFNYILYPALSAAQANLDGEFFNHGFRRSRREFSPALDGFYCKMALVEAASCLDT
jgi:hypothetical protein